MKANELKAGKRYYDGWCNVYYTGKTITHREYDARKGWKDEKVYVFHGQFGGPETYFTEAELERLVEL